LDHATLVINISSSGPGQLEAGQQTSYTTVAISKLKSNQHEMSINLPMDQGKSSQGMEADNPSHPMVKEATAAKTPVTERIKWI